MNLVAATSFRGCSCRFDGSTSFLTGIVKLDKISENPVFSRLLTFAPIITEESIRLTIPVAFIYKLL